jgi:hypothetical protein
VNPTAFTTYTEFAKVDSLPDGTLLVHTVINDETVDDQSEILDYTGTKAALDDFMVWANVREMHQPSAVGVVDVISHDDVAKASSGILHIVDPLAVQKVLAGVYKGTSVGGSKGLERVMEKVGGQTVTRLMHPVVKELSLVDRPSRPTARLSLLKMAAGDSIDRELAKGWMPAGVTNANLDDGDFAWVSDAYKAGKESKTAGRKLPYKIHGKVNLAGWKAAWTRAHQSGTDFSGGPSQQQVIDKLLKDKPGGVEVSDEAKTAAMAGGDLTKAADEQPDATGQPAEADEVAEAGDAPEAQPAEEPAPDDVQSAMDEAAAKIGQPDGMGKAAADDIVTIHLSKEQVARLIESETAEGDAPTVAALQDALAALNVAEASEQTELGTPEDTQEAEEEGVEDDIEDEADVAMPAPMSMAAIIDDLAKRAGMAKIGARNSANDQQALEQIHDLAVAAGAYPADHQPPGEQSDEEEGGTDNEKAARIDDLAKDGLMADAIVSLIADRLPLVKAADLEAMKTSFLEALETQRVELAKIAAQPMPGGPVRYASHARFGDTEQSPLSAPLQSVLQKISDPRVRDEVGQALAAEAIAGIHTNGNGR